MNRVVARQALAEIKNRETDVLILGGGLAALSAALEAARHGASVTVATKGRWGRSGASMLATGYAAALGHTDPRDNPTVHAEDTWRSSCGLGNRQLIGVMCDEAIPRLYELGGLGARFQKRGDRFLQYKGSGHTYPRTCLTVDQERPGIAEALASQLDGLDLTVFESTSALELLETDGSVHGALCADTGNDCLMAIHAYSTILATGGLGRLYKVTSNPEGLYGIGCALALHAGATLIDMEFVQFQPYRLIAPVALAGLTLASSTFEYGATIRNADGKDILAALDAADRPRTRDAVARATFLEILKGQDVQGGARLDLTHAQYDKVLQLNPAIAHLVDSHRLDLTKEELVVSPQAHFAMGGVAIDANAQTDIPGLFAVGEVTGGLHGANRLQDNAFAELFVFGIRAGASAAARACALARAMRPNLKIHAVQHWADRVALKGADLIWLKEVRRELRELLWQNAGVVRDETGLSQALNGLSRLSDGVAKIHISSPGELALLAESEYAIEIGELICRTALQRRESRGAHFRSDYPAPRADWERPIRVRKKPGKELEMV